MKKVEGEMKRVGEVVGRTNRNDREGVHES